jgi:hypothetical protein
MQKAPRHQLILSTSDMCYQCNAVHIHEKCCMEHLVEFAQKSDDHEQTEDRLPGYYIKFSTSCIWQEYKCTSASMLITAVNSFFIKFSLFTNGGSQSIVTIIN